MLESNNKKMKMIVELNAIHVFFINETPQFYKIWSPCVYQKN